MGWHVSGYQAFHRKLPPVCHRDRREPTASSPSASNTCQSNFLSHLMRDIHVTSWHPETEYHPQCDGMVERFNWTLKAMLRKHAATFGSQWDLYVSRALWAYRNVPHESTGEKPSFLLLEIDCRTPTEAALLPSNDLEVTEVSKYREKVILSLSTARRLAAESIRTAQARYKNSYDKTARQANYRYKLADWVLVHFPQDETGKGPQTISPLARTLSGSGPSTSGSDCCQDFNIPRRMVRYTSIKPSGPLPSRAAS